MALSELGEPDRYVYEQAKWTGQRVARSQRRRHQLGFLYGKEVQVHFTGKRLDGTLFASTREDGVPLTFIIGQENVMQGFSKAVRSMEAGEKAVFTIPPELAGTKSGCPASIPGNIPPNQTLRFDVELISCVTIIDIFDDKGILKKIVKDGIGYDSPRGFDEVLVNYNACIEYGVSVSKSKGVEFNLVEGFFCPAFAHAVKTMTEGEEAVLIIKPKWNEAAVPPDATLYVYLQLISWKTAIHIGEGHTIFKKTLRKVNSVGKYPMNQATVRVRLIGKLQDGAVFDQRGHEGDDSFEFVVDEEQVSDGLNEAVLTMEEGEIALFTIPPLLLHDQLVVVPAGSSVTYEIELVSVVNAKTIIFSQIMEREETDEEIDEIKQECAAKLQNYRQAKRHYDEILEFDPGNVKAQQLSEQQFPKDSLGIDCCNAQGLTEDAYELADMPRRVPSSASEMRPKQSRRKPRAMIFVPPIRRPDANVPTGDSPAIQATSDVNRSRATTSNENQNSGTTTPPGRDSVVASYGVSDHELNLTEPGHQINIAHGK